MEKSEPQAHMNQAHIHDRFIGEGFGAMPEKLTAREMSLAERIQQIAQNFEQYRQESWQLISQLKKELEILKQRVG